MTLLFCEHFDGYDTTAKYRAAGGYISGGGTYEPAAGRFGGGAARAAALSTGHIRLLKQAAAAASIFRVAYHIRCTMTGFSTTGTRPILQLRNGTPDRYYSHWGYDFGFAQSNGLYHTRFDDAQATGQMISGRPPTRTRGINDGNWHHVETALQVSTTVGNAQMWIDGVENTEQTVAGGDTSDAVSGDIDSFDRVVIAGCNSNSTAGSGGNLLWIDDLIIWDDSGTDFTGRLPGEHRLRRVLPTADGVLSQWIPNAGANYTAVDDASQDDDASYVEKNTSGRIDYYKNTSIGWTPASIIGVQVESVAKIDSGTQSWRNRLKDSSGTDRNGAAKAATTAYVKTEDFYGRNPATGAAWSKANIEASEFGVEFV